MLAWALDAAAAACDGVVVVVPEGAESAPALLAQCRAAHTVVAGGATRSASVRAGLHAVPAGVEVVAVHDAARPLAPLEVWDRVLTAVLSGADAAVPVVAVTDTVKQVDPDGSSRTLDRSRLVAVQTPQAFRTELLRRAHAGAPEATDDAAVVEAIGGRVELVAGDPCNVKITAPTDVVVAGALLAGQ